MNNITRRSHTLIGQKKQGPPETIQASGPSCSGSQATFSGTRPRKECTLYHRGSETKFEAYLTEDELKKANEDGKFAFDLVEKYYKLYSKNIIRPTKEPKSSIIIPKPTISVNNLKPSTSVSIVSSQEQESEEYFDSSVNPTDYLETGEMLEVRNYLTEDDDDLLISLVSERPLLYDNRLKRSREQIHTLWKEVISRMNLRITVGQIQYRWRSIRDRYLRARGNVKKILESGSSTAETLNRIKDKYKHYERLQFLEDTLTAKTTNPNVSVNDTEDSMEFSTQSECIPVNRSKKRNSEQLDAASVSESISPLASNYVCMRLAEGLERLPPNIKNKLELQFLEELSKAEERYCN